MQIKTVGNVSNLDNDLEFRRWVSITLDSIIQVINGNLSVDNLNAQIVTVNFTAANTTTPVAHTLGRVPNGYIPIGKSVSLDVYNGAPTYLLRDLIYLKSTVIGTASILIL